MPTNRLVIKEEVVTYASFLVDGAYEAGGQDAVLEVRNQLEQVVSAMRTNAELSDALDDSAYTPEQRVEIAKNVFSGCNDVLVGVISVMAERAESHLLSRVYDSYNNLLQSKLNMCVVDVTTAVPLDDSLREAIKSKAKSDLGMDAVLTEKVDKSILGGIIMSVNGRKIDASATTQLARARQQLKSTTDGGEC